MSRWPMILGFVGGAWGLLIAWTIVLLWVLFSPLGYDLTIPGQILILTMVIGSLSGIAGGALTRIRMTAGGLVLVGGASLALLGLSFQGIRTTGRLPSLTAMLVTVFFVGWIAFILGGGLFALFVGLIRLLRKIRSER